MQTVMKRWCWYQLTVLSLSSMSGVQCSGEQLLNCWQFDTCWQQARYSLLTLEAGCRVVIHTLAQVAEGHYHSAAARCRRLRPNSTAQLPS